MKNIITLIVLSLVLYLSNTKQLEAQTLSVHSSTGFINPERFIDGNNRSFSYLNKLTTGEIIFKLDRLCTINQLTVYLSEAYEDNAQFFVSTNAISYTKIGEVDDEFGVFNSTVNKDARYIKITGECSSDSDLLELAELSIDAIPLPVYTTQYQYDLVGNRVLRTTILLKSGEGESPLARFCKSCGLV